jgi:hypothetical protein
MRLELPAATITAQTFGGFLFFFILFLLKYILISILPLSAAQIEEEIYVFKENGCLGV